MMYINAIGNYIPQNRIPNSYFEEVNGLTDEWIYQRTGIKSRARASEEETMEYMCKEAVKQSLAQLPYSITEVDLIVFASYTPSDTVGTTGHVIQREHQIENAKVFYISSACSSGINALEIIQSFMNSGLSSKALLICADRNSSFSNDADSISGHLWGDAAVAVFLSKEKQRSGEGEVIAVNTQGLGHIGKGPDGVRLPLPEATIVMPYGKDVFTYACTYISEHTQRILEENQYTIDDLTYFIGHQANMRIIKNVAQRLNLPVEKTLSNIEEMGNTGSVSSLLVLATNYTKFKSGDLICLAVFGGGYSAGACLIKMSN